MDLRHSIGKFLQISIYPLRVGVGLHSTCSSWLVLEALWVVITNSKAIGDACNGPDVLRVEVASCCGPVGC